MFTEDEMKFFNSGIVFNLERFISSFTYCNNKLIFFTKSSLSNGYKTDIKYYLDSKEMDVYLRIEKNFYVRINSFNEFKRKYQCNEVLRALV